MDVEVVDAGARPGHPRPAEGSGPGYRRDARARGAGGRCWSRRGRSRAAGGVAARLPRRAAGLLPEEEAGRAGSAPRGDDHRARGAAASDRPARDAAESPPTSGAHRVDHARRPDAADRARARHWLSAAGPASGPSLHPPGGSRGIVGAAGTPAMSAAAALAAHRPCQRARRPSRSWPSGRRAPRPSPRSRSRPSPGSARCPRSACGRRPGAGCGRSPRRRARPVDEPGDHHRLRPDQRGHLEPAGRRRPGPPGARSRSS